MARRRILWALAPLIALHTLILVPGFIAPYDFSEQNRMLPYAPPTGLHFVDQDGRFYFRPFVYQRVPDDVGLGSHEDRSARFPLRFFVRGASYDVLGFFESDLHLFGVDEPARIFLLGSDGFGRDQFSRLLYGCRISLFAGLLAATLSLVLGLGLGSLAGFYGRWTDTLVMRGSELFMTLPWLYLLLGVRAFLPLSISPMQTFLLLVILIGAIGWARPSRLFRGVILSAKERDFVAAARGFGASDLYLLRRHLLPQTYGLLATQAALLAPAYVMAEVTLSFFGLGVAEPVPSLGNMLAAAQKYHVLVSHRWMLVPAGVLVIVLAAYHRLARVLQPSARI